MRTLWIVQLLPSNTQLHMESRKYEILYCWFPWQLSPISKWDCKYFQKVLCQNKENRLTLSGIDWILLLIATYSFELSFAACFNSSETRSVNSSLMDETFELRLATSVCRSAVTLLNPSPWNVHPSLQQKEFKVKLEHDFFRMELNADK